MFSRTRRGPAGALRDALPVRVAALAVACLLGLSLLSVSRRTRSGNLDDVPAVHEHAVPVPVPGQPADQAGHAAAPPGCS